MISTYGIGNARISATPYVCVCLSVSVSSFILYLPANMMNDDIEERLFAKHLKCDLVECDGQIWKRKSLHLIDIDDGS